MLLYFYVIGKGGEIQKIGEFCLVFSEIPNMSELNIDNTPLAAVPGGPVPPGSQPPAAIPPPTSGTRPINGPRLALNNGGSWPASTQSGGNGSAPYRGNSTLLTKSGNKRDPRKR